MAQKTVRIFDAEGIPQGLRFGIDNSQVWVSLRDYLIHTGKIVYISNFERITGAGTKKYLHIYIPTMEDASIFECHIRWKITSDSEFEVVTYYDPVTTAYGTKVPIGNKNALYESAPRYVQIYEDGTYGDLGLQVLADIIGSGKDNEAGQEAVGEFVLVSGTNYIMEFTKVAATIGWVSWYFEWSEHYEGDVHPITTTTTSTTSTTTTTTTTTTT